MDRDTNTVTAECGETCSGCGQLRRELDAALLILNEQSCAKYGDLLRDNFALTQKVATLLSLSQYRFNIALFVGCGS